MSVFMKINGVSGGVTAKGHENWIQIESLSFAVNRNVSTRTGRSADRESSAPSFQNVAITKFTDQSSSDLLTKMCQGKAIPEVTIDVCYTDSELSPHLQYTLKNVIISYMSEIVEASISKPLEKLQLDYTHIEKKYTSRDSSNQLQTPKSVGYNLETAELM